jgi:hypothetical protein
MNRSLEWGTSASAAPGEKIIGDRAVVAFAPGYALAATIDGVGHGTQAAAAASAATTVLEQSAKRDVVSAMEECHVALRDTRGAALSLASFDGRRDTMTWLGVGNVEARLLRGAQPAPVTESLLLSGGTVGRELPRLAPQTTQVTRGDVLIFATDGIDPGFADLLVPSGSCSEIADHTLREHARGFDDALVLVVRYLGA